MKWEHYSYTYRQRQLKRGWYDCLLLFCGALICLASAYRQLNEILGGMNDLALPKHAMFDVLFAAALLAVCYGSGLLRRTWMRILPIVPMAVVFLRYYLLHRLKTEDGILYILRMYVAEICKYYKCVIIFPIGLEEEAPAALLFWMLLIFLALFVLAGVVQRMELVAVLPLAMLIAGIAVGKVPGWESMLLLFAGVIVLRMYQMPATERLPVRAAQLAGLLCVCILTGTLCSHLADGVVAKHDVMMKRQLAMEDAVLALPVWDLFIQNGTVTNDAPRSAGRDVLTIALSEEATENIYLRDFAADHYENGRWSTSTDAFVQAASTQGMTTQEAGEKIWNLFRTKGEAVLVPENGRAAIGNAAFALPKEYEYTITCRGFGRTAPLPYLSNLPQQLTAESDAAVKKPWTKRTYGGSLMMSGNEINSLIDYLGYYYASNSMLAYGGGMSDRKAEEAWYEDFVSAQYTDASDIVSLDAWDAWLESSGFMGWLGFSSESARLYMRSLQEENNVPMLNLFRLSFASIVQSVLQWTGTYSKDLDPLPAGADPVDYFLNESWKGYCVHFASAATLVLQAMDIPARYASGYVVFPKDFKKTEDGYTATVTDARAHAWVEVYLEDMGWIPCEVTPGFAAGDESGGASADADEKTDQKEPSGPDTEQPDADRQEEEEQPSDEKNDRKEHEDNKVEMGNDAYKGMLDTIVFGRTMFWWIYVLIGLFVFYFAVCLLKDGIHRHNIKMHRMIQHEIGQNHGRTAILHMNRRIYRMLFFRTLFSGTRIRDDQSYSHALQQFCESHKITADLERYMILVKQAYFSEDEMSISKAFEVYRVYKRLMIERKGW